MVVSERGLITGEMETFDKGGSGIVKNKGSGDRGRSFLKKSFDKSWSGLVWSGPVTSEGDDRIGSGLLL